MHMYMKRILLRRLDHDQNVAIECAAPNDHHHGVVVVDDATTTSSDKASTK